jgi:hypothetical protein
VITSGANGFTYRTDDFAGTFAAAANQTFTNNTFSVNGVVEQNTDADMFKFTIAQQQRFVLNANPYSIGSGNVGSDLDLQVTLYNSSQSQLNIFNPGTLLNSVIDTVLNAGTYYLKIEGKGNIYAPNYASLGSYSLQGSIAASTLPLRKLELQGALVSDKHKLTWIIDADEQVISQVLEMSTDGRSFRPVTQPATTDRTFTNMPLTSSAVQYRLKVTFDNDKTYYSNVVTLRNINNDLYPKLISNLVNNNLLVTSPANFNFRVFDMNGRMTAMGNLSKGMNTIPTQMLTSGMYIIKFNDETSQWTDKFVRQ